MKENQNTEWKESWRDDYLRWVCGFANAEGGTLVIGRNDLVSPAGGAQPALARCHAARARHCVAGAPAFARRRRVQVNKTIEVLQAKYMKALISYDGLQRVETWPVPLLALREAVLNAVVHKDYTSGAPIQISVYADKLMIWNSGRLPPRVDSGAFAGQACLGTL